MAPKGVAVSTITIAAVFAVLLVAVSAQTSADCTSSEAALVPCYTYVTGSGSTPPSTCCQGLTSLNTNNPTCLCQVISQQLNSSAAGVNVTKAYSLPKDCGVTIDTKTCPALANIMAPPSGSPAVAGPVAAPSGPGSAPGAVPPGTGSGSSFSPSRWVILASVLAVVWVQSFFHLF